MFMVGGREESEGEEEDQAVCAKSVFKFDGRTQVWSEVAPMPDGRYAASACVLGDSIYHFGGEDETGETTATTFKFDCNSEEWSELAPMPEPKHRHSVCAFEGLIYVLGGNLHSSTVNRFDPEANAWTEVCPMSTARQLLFTSFVLAGSLYAAGGWDEAGNNIASVERYSVASDSWEEVEELEMLRARCSFSAVAIGVTRSVDFFDNLIAKAKQAQRPPHHSFSRQSSQ
jgi:N-acetylneuraminic acid mutarotase